jgi:hypothetical protein
MLLLSTGGESGKKGAAARSLATRQSERMEMMEEEQVTVTATMSQEQWNYIARSLEELKAYKEAGLRESDGGNLSSSSSASKRARRKRKKQQQSPAVGMEDTATGKENSVLQQKASSPAPPAHIQRDQRSVAAAEIIACEAPRAAASAIPRKKRALSTAAAPVPAPSPNKRALQNGVSSKRAESGRAKTCGPVESFVDGTTWNLAFPLWMLVGVAVRCSHTT